jgi:hypothetical protein
LLTVDLGSLGAKFQGNIAPDLSAIEGAFTLKTAVGLVP